MSSEEDQDIIPTIIALAVIGITIHLTNGVGILTTLIAKLNLKRKAMQKASEAADGSVSGVFVHPGKYHLVCDRLGCMDNVSLPLSLLQSSPFVQFLCHKLNWTIRAFMGTVGSCCAIQLLNGQEIRDTAF